MPKKPKALRCFDSGWTIHGVLVRRVERGARRLVVSVTQIPEQEQLWSGVAVETSTSAETPDDVFAQHAHATIVERVPMRTAVAAADGYIEQWLQGKPSDNCDCGPIETPAPPTMRPAALEKAPPTTKPAKRKKRNSNR